jgi:peptide chain release factor subunit 1
MELTKQIDRLAGIEPAPYPVISLYLNAEPGPTGRDQWQTFFRKEIPARTRTFPPHSHERASLERDLPLISSYLGTELQPSTNGVAIFACSAGNLFEAVQLGVPFSEHWLSIGDRPHLYPLARIASQYPRYAAVLADTNYARILVIAAGEVVASREVIGVKTRRTDQGGWSQARFQRHIEDFHLHHAKAVVDALEQIVQQEGIEHIVLAGDEEVILPLLRDQMSKMLAEKIVDHLRVEAHAPVSEMVRASLEAMARVNQRTDKEKVEAAVSAYRAGGLGVVGVDETLTALTFGQVDELLLTASVRELRGSTHATAAMLDIVNDVGLAEAAVPTIAAGEAASAVPEIVRLADALVTKAKNTGATITFIEDSRVLRPYGGAAALLRFSRQEVRRLTPDS